jgi:hypothetical protein
MTFLLEALILPIMFSLLQGLAGSLLAALFEAVVGTAGVTTPA